MTIKFPHEKQSDFPLNFSFTSAPVEEIDVYDGLTIFVGKDLGEIRSVVTESFQASPQKRVAVLTDNAQWSERWTSSTDEGVFSRPFPSNSWKQPHPWNSGSEFDPFGALIRTSMDLFIVDDADSRVLWFPWTTLTQGLSLSVLIDETRWLSLLPNGFNVDDVWNLVQTNVVAASRLGYVFHTEQPFRIARLGADNTWNYQIVTPQSPLK